MVKVVTETQGKRLLAFLSHILLSWGRKLFLINHGLHDIRNTRTYGVDNAFGKLPNIRFILFI